MTLKLITLSAPSLQKNPVFPDDESTRASFVARIRAPLQKSLTFRQNSPALYEKSPTKRHTRPLSGVGRTLSNQTNAQHQTALLVAAARSPDRYRIMPLMFYVCVCDTVCYWLL